MALLHPYFPFISAFLLDALLKIWRSWRSINLIECVDGFAAGHFISTLPQPLANSLLQKLQRK